MIAIAIDGACRRNGKKDCIAAAGVFVARFDKSYDVLESTVLSNYELESTNQRGELLAYLTTLEYLKDLNEPAQIITDSEYLFNAITKDWCSNWAKKGWKTASGDPVKNMDLWVRIMEQQDLCENIETTLYHIKGHAISFGKVTAKNLLAQDPSGLAMYNAAAAKYATAPPKPEVYKALKEVSIKNNGFSLEFEILKRFIVMNTVADAVATKCVETADALM